MTHGFHQHCLDSHGYFALPKKPRKLFILKHTVGFFFWRVRCRVIVALYSEWKDLSFLENKKKAQINTQLQQRKKIVYKKILLHLYKAI